MEPVQSTTAYQRLLAELSHLDRLTTDVQIGDQALPEWLAWELRRQGSVVQPQHDSNTVFDDLLAYCRSVYIQHVHQMREETAKAAKRKAEEEAKRRIKEEAKRKFQEEAKRKAQEKGEEESRREAEENTKRRSEASASQTSYGRHGAESCKPGASHETKFTKSFDDRQEARLYLHLARLHLSSKDKVRSYSKADQWHVELRATVGICDDLNLAFRKLLHQLQSQALSVRVEALKVRDEAIRHAHQKYELQVDESFTNVVDNFINSKI